MGINVKYPGGSHTIEVGNTFWTRMGTKPGRYRVKALHGLVDHNGKHSVSSYSPSDLGGTPTIGCENVRTGEIVDFCGDSVALMLAHPDTEPDGWNEEEQRKRNAQFYSMMLES